MEENEQKKMKEPKPGRNDKGQFVKGHQMSKKTQFKVGNTDASKYQNDYGEKMLRYFLDENTLYPSFEGFASVLGVTSKTLRNWRDNYPQFAEFYERADEIQKFRLMVGGLSGKYNAQFAKFLLMNQHGMAERADSDSGITFKFKFEDELNEESD